MDVQDAQKTAVITPFGLFQFARMPFGLRNAAATFQRFLDHVIRGLPGVVVYVDDLLVFANSKEQQVQRLKALLQRLREFGLSVNDKKCTFLSQSIHFLGYLITPDGYEPIPDRVNAISTSPTPTNIAQVRRFIGMANFYRQHIPQFARLMTPLYDIKEPFVWSDASETAFNSIKRTLSQVALLQPPNPSLTYHTFTDASNNAVGATILQQGKPLAYYSSRLTATEKRYSTFDREALAVVKALKAYKHWFLGATVVVHTDHKPLLGFLQMKDPSPRQSRWIESLSQLNITWKHEPGAQNSAADFLSRPQEPDIIHVTATSLHSIGPPEWTRILANYQPQPDEESSLQLERINDIWFDTSKGKPRVVVPPQLHKECFNLIHNTSHFGVKKTLNLMRSRFIWSTMRRDVARWCAECQPCQISKPSLSCPRIPLSFAVHERFHTVHIDIVGPLPVSRAGKQYLLTMVDRFTRWIEAIPIANISSETCAKVFLENWVCRYGVPAKVVSDQGTQFESSIFTSLLKRLSIERHRTTAYHPQSNGAVERAHRTLKQCLRAISDRRTCWEEALPLVLLAMRTSTCESTQFPPSQLVLGGEIRLPADFLAPIESQAMTQEEFAKCLWSEIDQDTSTASENQPERIAQEVNKCPKWVWLKQPPGHHGSLKPLYTGPFEVLRQDSTVVTINLNGKQTRVNIDRLKPATLLYGEPISPTIHPSRSIQNSGDKDTAERPILQPPQDETLTIRPNPNQSTPVLPVNPPATHSHYGRPLTYSFNTPKYTGATFVRKRKMVGSEL
jgi:transposase InsO family protein